MRDGIAHTVNTVDVSEDLLDLGWARGVRDRLRGVITVQCWGCGAHLVVLDSPVIEMHFQHANASGCSLDRCYENRASGRMPGEERH